MINFIQYINLSELNVFNDREQNLKNWLNLLIIQRKINQHDVILINNQQNKSLRSNNKNILTTKLQLL